jgi:phosphoglycolate phosphatase
MPSYDAVIFDNDGVLVGLTDGDLLDVAAREAFESCGVSDPDEDHVKAARHADLDGLAAIEDVYDVDPATVWEARDQQAIERQCAAIANGGKPLFDDVEALYDLPTRLGVVSNNQHETVNFVVDHYGLEHLFETVIGRDPTWEGVQNKKPDPYYLDQALEELDAEDALYVGDFPKDVAVAHRAGIDSAYLVRPHRDQYDLDHEPTYRVESLSELVTELTE